METVRAQCSCRSCGNEADLIVDCERALSGELELRERWEPEACQGAECYFRGTEPGFVEEGPE